MKKIKIAIIGAGVRGRYTYGDYIQRNKDLYEVVSVVENKIGRRNKLKEIFNLSDEQIFEDMDSFFESEKIADVVIISSIENTHYEGCIRSLQKGYDVLVEGPVVNNLDQVINLQQTCEKNKDKIFMASMPYRYSYFFEKLKSLIDSEEFGNLININYNSYVGYEKFVHKYVRGNWRLDSDSAPILLTNSCYDIDILEYLTNSKCEKISCFSNLNHFKRENLKLDMSELCIRCSRDTKCPFYAQKIYLNNKELSKSIHINPTKDNISEILNKSQYGQCVYSCDNNVSDNLISIIKFKNNITASLNISAFTQKEDINIRLMFTKGEIYGNLNEHSISIKKFIDNDEIIIKLPKDNMDDKLIESFFDAVRNRKGNTKSTVSSILNSHIVAFAGEFANVSETVVDVDKFYNEAVEMTKSIEKLFL